MAAIDDFHSAEKPDLNVGPRIFWFLMLVAPIWFWAIVIRWCAHLFS